MPSAFGPHEAARIRQALLDAGRDQLARTGFRKTSVDSLVKAAGISKGSFYLFFPSKSALWLELLNSAEQAMRAQLLAMVTSEDEPPAGRLRAVLQTLFDAVTNHPLLRALADPQDMAWLLRKLPEGTFERSRQDDRRFFDELLKILQRQGVVSRSVSRQVFSALPPAALALAQGRGLFDEAGGEYSALIDFQVSAWEAQLRAQQAPMAEVHASAQK